MIITDVRVAHLREVSFPQPLYPTWRLGGAWTGVAPILVRIHTDEGITGIGASQSAPSQQVCDYLIGKDPFATEQHIQVMRHAARNGNAWVLDLALWDLIGKACGQPLYKLWGGFTDRVLAYASLAEMGTPEERAEMALRLLEEGFKEADLKDLTVYKPAGCERCTNGYKGRVGIFQVMPVSEEMGRIIMEGGNSLQLADQATKEGVATLRQSGLNKVKAGVTSLEEINRVTKD